MRISLNWLSDYIDIRNKDIKEIAKQITASGIAVETVEKLCNATNIVVGEVLERKDHPKSDHLNVCKVNLGEEIVTIVCGASNVRENTKVIVAKDGAILPNIEIKKTTIRDVESNGMICALNELGLPDFEEYKDGIHILPNEAVVGENPLKYIGYDDVIFNLDLNPNRFDCMSITGFAYEVGAVLNEKINEKEFKVNEINESTKDLIKINNQTDNCKMFTTKIVKDVVIKESPDFIKSRLLSSGIRSINNVVDISNYVMLEYNQPLHFYDYNKVGNEITIRMAQENEELTTLDNQTRKLTTNDIVIANKENILGIAGVMGGLSSVVTKETDTILIESAIFDSYSVRYTSIRNNLRSEASLRFEKELNKERTLQALNYAAYLLETYASGKVLKDEVIYDNLVQNEKTIEIDLEKINNVLGMTLNTNDVKDVFNRLMFKYDVQGENFIVTVPNRRSDISIKEDLIEEVGRLYGFDKIVGKTPTTSIKSGSYTKLGSYIKTIQNTFEKLGLTQVRTYTLIGDKELNLLKNKDVIKLSLPMSEDKKYIRTSLIPSLINTFEYNSARGIKDIAIYETSTVYVKGEDKYIEENLVSGLLTGKYLYNNWQNKQNDIDFYTVKGILESLMDYLGLNGRIVFEKNTIDEKTFHPGRSAIIKVDNKVVGVFGNVNPSISKNDYILFELNIDTLMDMKVREIKFKEASKYPSVNRDFAVIVDKNIEVEQIIKTIKKSSSKLLSEVEIFDLYTDNDAFLNKKSVAFSLTFKDNTRTLEQEEVNTLFNDIIKAVEQKFDATLRSK